MHRWKKKNSSTGINLNVQASTVAQPHFRCQKNHVIAWLAKVFILGPINFLLLVSKARITTGFVQKNNSFLCSKKSTLGSSMLPVSMEVFKDNLNLLVFTCCFFTVNPNTTFHLCHTWYPHLGGNLLIEVIRGYRLSKPGGSDIHVKFIIPPYM